jgi:hypothetical protein
MSAAVVTICFSFLYRSLGLVGCSRHTGGNACQLVDGHRIRVLVGKSNQRRDVRQVAALDRLCHFKKLNGVHLILWSGRLAPMKPPPRHALPPCSETRRKACYSNGDRCG